MVAVVARPPFELNKNNFLTKKLLSSYVFKPMGFLQEPTVQAFILPKSSIRVVDTGLRQNTCLHSGLLQKPQAPMPCQCQFDILSSRQEVVINNSYSITPSKAINRTHQYYISTFLRRPMDWSSHRRLYSSMKKRLAC